MHVNGVGRGHGRRRRHQRLVEGAVVSCRRRRVVDAVEDFVIDDVTDRGAVDERGVVGDGVAVVGDGVAVVANGVAVVGGGVIDRAGIVKDLRRIKRCGGGGGDGHVFGDGGERRLRSYGLEGRKKSR